MRKNLNLVKIKVLLSIFLIGGILGSGTTYYVLSQGSSQRDVYLDDLPSTTTWTFETDGSNYWAIRDDGYVNPSLIDSDAETALQALFNTVATGERIFIKNFEISLTTGLTIPSFASGIQVFGERTWACADIQTFPRFKTTQQIDLLTIQAVNVLIKYFDFETGMGHTESAIVMNAMDIKVEECTFHQNGIGVKANYPRNDVLRCYFMDCEIGVEMNNVLQMISWNRMYPALATGIGIKVTKAHILSEVSFNLIHGSGSGGGYGIQYVPTASSNLRIVGGLIEDVYYGIFANESSTTSRIFIKGTTFSQSDIFSYGTYDIQIQNMTFASIQGTTHNLLNADAIRLDGSDQKTALMGICVERQSGGSGDSYSSTESPTVIERGCYSFDGLLEAL